jgi:hypothetical protein
MNDDPQEISKHLIAQHGAPDAALAAAAVGAVEAQKKKDLYRLSAYSVMLSGYCGIWLKAKRSSFLELENGISQSTHQIVPQSFYELLTE